MQRLMAILFLLTTLVFVTACGPSYPKCDNNDDCASSEKGQSESKLYCVNGLCQQCAEDADCGDSALECNAGICEQISNYCAGADDCPINQRCRDNRCGAQCLDDSECPDGGKCVGGVCDASVTCSGDSDCPDGQICENGQCQARADSSCSLDTLYFDYDSSTMDASAKSVLQSNADCIKKDNLSVRIEGHCDERGSNEYNIALGQRRATVAYKYIRSLGVKKANMDTISYGEEQLASDCGESGPASCQGKNRRVVIRAR